MNAPHRIMRRIAPTAALAAALMLVGCSDSPTEPGAQGGGGTGFTDSPDIPEPQTVGGDVPARSATLTRIEPLSATYRPFVIDVYGSWQGVAICDPDPMTLQPTEQWSQPLHFGVLPGLRHFQAHAAALRSHRLTLLDPSGAPMTVHSEHTSPYLTGSCVAVTTEFTGEPLETPVFVRRDRHWELRPLEGQAGDLILIYPQTEGEVSTSYTSGTTTTETQDFGNALTLQGGLSLGPLSASVSSTLTETFSSAVSISQAKTETFLKRVIGKPDTVIQFMVWERVDSYAFCDAEGNPVESANYIIAPAAMTLRGTAVALVATEFALP
jgi:hypothetical protein